MERLGRPFMKSRALNLLSHLIPKSSMFGDNFLYEKKSSPSLVPFSNLLGEQRGLIPVGAEISRLRKSRFCFSLRMVLAAALLGFLSWHLIQVRSD